MDHNMIVSYGYCRWQNWQCNERTPLSQAILMVMRTHWSNARGIARFRKSRATLDAPGRRHWATTSSVSPQRPPGQQKNKQQSTNDSIKVAKLMAMAMRRYVTAHIARWRGSKPTAEATGRRLRASIAGDSGRLDKKNCFFSSFFIVDQLKRGLRWRQGP